MLSKTPAISVFCLEVPSKNIFLRIQNGKNSERINKIFQD